MEKFKSVLSILPVSGFRISRGENWVGFYINRDEHGRGNAWFGFVPNERIGISPKGRSNLIVAATYDCKPDQNYFKPQAFQIPIWFQGAKEAFHWIINFNATWNKPSIWEEKLNSFWQNDN